MRWWRRRRRRRWQRIRRICLRLWFWGWFLPTVKSSTCSGDPHPSLRGIGHQVHLSSVGGDGGLSCSCVGGAWRRTERRRQRNGVLRACSLDGCATPVGHGRDHVVAEYSSCPRARGVRDSRGAHACCLSGSALLEASTCRKDAQGRRSMVRACVTAPRCFRWCWPPEMLATASVAVSLAATAAAARSRRAAGALAGGWSHAHPA